MFFSLISEMTRVKCFQFTYHAMNIVMWIINVGQNNSDLYSKSINNSLEL